MATARILSDHYLYPPDPAFAKRVDAYIEELNILYTEIEGWLPVSAEATRTNTVFEYWDGHYDAPALNIRYGELFLRLIPAGVSLGSGALVYFKVKPEHRDSYAREVHILKEDTLWIEVRKAPKTLPNVYPFNRESFLDILKEISVYS